MEIKQVYEIVNATTKEVLGETVVLNEDLSNIVDIGTAVFNSGSFDHYCKKLVDQVGRMVFVIRKYNGSSPRLLKDGWEFGAVRMKVRSDLPEATINEDWELQNGQSYDPNIFNGANVETKFYNKRVTFELDRSITEKQLKSGLQNASQLNSFVTMIYNEIDKSLTIKLDTLIRATVNGLMAETIHDEYPSADYSTKSTVKAINLLKLYNDEKGTALTAEQAIKNDDFIRFASYMIKLYAERLSTMSTLFNVGKKATFTPSDKLHLVMLSEFKTAADIYLQSSTFHDELTKLPMAESVVFWQGSGTDYGFTSTSKINVKSPSGNNVEMSGIICTMFDDEAAMVCNEDRTVNTQYNAKANFTNYFYKQDAEYLIDTNENCIVFFVA